MILYNLIWLNKNIIIRIIIEKMTKRRNLKEKEEEEEAAENVRITFLDFYQ